MEFNIVERMLALTLLGTEWVLWLLIILSIVSIAIMFERMFFFSRMRINFQQFSNDLVKFLIDDDIESAKKLCDSQTSLETQVALRGLSHRAKGVKAMRESMEGFLVGEKQVLDRGLVVLGTLGNNAPFIGLFGTVIGIIMAFKDLSMNSAGGPSVVMAGISEALVATAVGLIVAIPAVIAFNGFNRIVKRHYANAEAVMRLILSHHQ